MVDFSKVFFVDGKQSTQYKQRKKTAKATSTPPWRHHGHPYDRYGHGGEERCGGRAARHGADGTDGRWCCGGGESQAG